MHECVERIYVFTVSRALECRQSLYGQFMRIVHDIRTAYHCWDFWLTDYHGPLLSIVTGCSISGMTRGCRMHRSYANMRLWTVSEENLNAEELIIFAKYARNQRTYMICKKYRRYSFRDSVTYNLIKILRVIFLKTRSSFL